MTSLLRSTLPQPSPDNALTGHKHRERRESEKGREGRVGGFIGAVCSVAGGALGLITRLMLDFVSSRQLEMISIYPLSRIEQARLI